MNTIQLNKDIGMDIKGLQMAKMVRPDIVDFLEEI
jgi:hypothetical protein